MRRIIKEKAVRLRRFSRGRGFGVQSPSDYNFITKVIKVHGNEECCTAADSTCSDLRGNGYRLEHLCYRVARYMKPTVCAYLTADKNISSYLKAAVPDIKIKNEMSFAGGERCMVILSCADMHKYIEEVMNAAADDTLLLVDGINSSDDNINIWKKIVADDRARITFDLYHYGIVCFNSKRYKQNYKIYL